MRLYLVRHGKAEDGAEDADRRLSPRGESDVQAMAAHLADQGVAVARVYHSTLSRARQTAQILGKALAPETACEELPGIEPWGDVAMFARLVDSWDQDAMVCGHEPFMGQMASVLMTGNRYAEILAVKTGTVMALEKNTFGPGWQLRWMLTPRMVRGALN